MLMEEHEARFLRKRIYNAEWRQKNKEYYNMYMREYMAWRRIKKEEEKIEKAREWLRRQNEVSSSQ